jgi:hypothetical protein
LTTQVVVLCNAGQHDVAVEIANVSKGGWSEADVTDVAVKPAGPPTPSNVTTATPAGCRRKAPTNVSGSVMVLLLVMLGELVGPS